MKLNNRIVNDPLLILRVGLGLVFLLAGVHRLVFFDIARQNFIDLGLQPASLLVILVIIMEFIAGILFIINRHIIRASLLIMAVMIIGIGASVLRAGNSLWTNANELFVLTYTPTNIVLHISYLAGIITVMLWVIKEKKSKKK